VFGTEQDTIINSRHPSHNVPKDQSVFDELLKNATCESDSVLEFENEVQWKSNQVLATEHDWYLLVFIGKIWVKATKSHI
jgi:hypothetical protein